MPPALLAVWDDDPLMMDPMLKSPCFEIMLISIAVLFLTCIILRVCGNVITPEQDEQTFHREAADYFRRQNDNRWHRP